MATIENFCMDVSSTVLFAEVRRVAEGEASVVGCDKRSCMTDGRPSTILYLKHIVVPHSA